MDEAITKAQQGANLLASDLMEAYRAACRIQRPEGPSRGDKAIMAYLLERLDIARKLESDLLNL